MKNTYLVASDDIFLREERIKQLIAMAEKEGYDSPPQKFILGEDAQHRQLLDEIKNPSLFVAKKILLVISHGATPNQETEKTIGFALDGLGEDTLLLFSMPYLSPRVRQKGWFKQLSKQGEYVALFAPAGTKLVDWLKQRAAKLKLNMDNEAVEFLAQQSEGNLIGAVQELEKLAMAYSDQPISYKEASQFLGDSAHYEFFALSDSILSGEITRCRLILQRLYQRKEQATRIIWLLNKDLKMLGVMAANNRMSDGELRRNGFFGPRQSLLRRAATKFQGRQGGVLKTLARMLASADRAAKGGRGKSFSTGEDAWPIIEAVALRMAGLPTPAAIAYARMEAGH